MWTTNTIFFIYVVRYTIVQEMVTLHGQIFIHTFTLMFINV